MDEEAYDVAIVGAGPAGMTAGIYCIRNGLKTVLLDSAMAGGQLMTSPVIENYPTHKTIEGPPLAELLKSHTEEYLKINEFEEVNDVKKEGNDFILYTSKALYRIKALILATGASHKKLGISSEDKFLGRGVSYCATCDGFFFRQKKVAMIGGGNTAAVEAIYLKSIGCDVTMIHRRNSLRAEAANQRKLKEMGVKILYSHNVEDIIGGEMVEGVKVKDLNDGNESIIDVKGVFISIGVQPHTSLAKKLGVDVDSEGFIKVDRNMRTSVRMIYSAGDVTGGVKQIIVACGEGAVAATSAYEDIVNPYWKK